MNNFNDFKTPLSWILGSFFVVYLCFVIVNHSQSENLFADNWNNTNDWHFDQISTNINQNTDFNSTFIFTENITPSVNNMNFHYGNVSLVDVQLFQVNSNEVVINDIDSISSQDTSKIDSQKEVVLEKETKINEKSVLNKNNKIVKETPKIIQETPNIISDNTTNIILDNDDEKIEGLEQDTEEEKEIIEEAEVDQDIAVENRNVQKKTQDIQKPKFKDYKNSIEYQNALREYYKAIE